MLRPDSANAMDVLVGGRVRELRLTAGLAQSTCAQVLGLSVEHLAACEAGEERLPAKQLFKIAQLLGVSLSSLFAGIRATTDDDEPYDDPPTHT